MAEQKNNFAKTGHLTHLEDLVHHHGNEGVEHAADFLDAVHTHLLGKQKASFTGQKAKPHILEKGDGAPAIIFGHNPHNKKFFVATKSLKNKEPKINYNHEDIETNHGDKPGLADKLKKALEHLPKVAPKEGIFQGDYYYDHDTLERKGSQFQFTPNTITYKVPKNSRTGEKIARSKMGILVHTKHKGTINNLTPEPLSDHSDWKEHDDVHVVSPAIHPQEDKYTPEHMTNFLNHLENAKMHYKKMKLHELDDHVSPHKDTLDTYINSTVKNDSELSHGGYITHLKNKMQKDVEKYKTPQRKQKAQNEWSKKIEHAIKHKKSFENHFELHDHITKAKEALIDALDNHNKEFNQFIGNKRVGPEGYVVYHGNKEEPVKLVRRKGETGFSRLNFAMGKMQEQRKKEQEKKIKGPKVPKTLKEGEEYPNKWWKDWPEREKKIKVAKEKHLKSLTPGIKKYKEQLKQDPYYQRDLQSRKEYYASVKKEETEHKKGVVFAFGRMNPPTKGHEKLINKVHELAKKHNAHHEIMLSHSHDSQKNPLHPDSKINHAKKMFPNTNFSKSSKEHPTLLHQAAQLHKQGHRELHMIGGSDRAEHYKELLHKYNGVKSKHGYYKFDKIHVHSAGHRDESKEGTEGASASKMRAHAHSNDYNSFKGGLPSHVSHEHAKKLFKDVRKGLGHKD